MRKLLVGLLTFAPALLAAQSPARWWPQRGTVVLAGGGLQQATADKFVDSLIAIAGGPDATIVIIPTAFDGLPSLLPGKEPANVLAVRRHFASRGAKHIAFMDTSDRHVANTTVHSAS